MNGILKDGSYIQYGPKIIPNPNAEGGEGGGGLSTCKVEVKACLSGTDTIISDFVLDEINTFITNEQIIMTFTQASTILQVPFINNDLVYQPNYVGGSDDEHFYILDQDNPIKSVSGDALINEINNVIITGDCTITLNVILD